MAGELIFVTGAAGFVGTHLINQALQAGYRIRASVRREAQVADLEKFFAGKDAEFVLVPDMTVADAYNGKLDGVDYVAHVASPLALSGTKWREDYIDPAVNGVKVMLDAAAKVKSIKRVVVTESIASLIPLEGLPEGAESVHEYSAPTINVDPDQDFAGPFVAYQASKILSDQYAHNFMREKKPSFSLVTIHPTFIFGRNLLQTSISQLTGTNGLFMQTITAQIPRGSNRGIHVIDVADAHLKALDPKIENGSKFLVSEKPFKWEEVLAYVKEKWPSDEWKLGDAPAGQMPWADTKRAETILGMKWRSWKEMTDDVVGQMAELKAKEAKI
ncbi:3-beta hydroxysteroid dehydrogenase/isomerase family protein [Aulographum hederae CBS 113979]|uniref:3-beta hydroxysteroid dehydrogenase/isomerase family protein n=1 Tax=Aulographum hederae CBS 113979 TaxID=1176131 RepID=A0A6G1H9I8_9PEZI|nr:3-beta hydroxysteroid dehydrogenase/isomerase family protein [Aulographum hederae CBS 113979]